MRIIHRLFHESTPLCSSSIEDRSIEDRHECNKKHPLIILYITIRPLAGSLNNHYQFKEGFRQSLFFERLNQTYFCPITAFHTSNDKSNTTNTKKMQQKQNKYGLSVYHAVKPAHKKDLSVSCHPTSIAR